MSRIVRETVVEIDARKPLPTWKAALWVLLGVPAALAAFALASYAAVALAVVVVPLLLVVGVVLLVNAASDA